MNDNYKTLKHEINGRTIELENGNSVFVGRKGSNKTEYYLRFVAKLHIGTAKNTTITDIKLSNDALLALHKLTTELFCVSAPEEVIAKPRKKVTK